MDATVITLNRTSVDVDSASVTVAGTTVTIRAGGMYRLTDTLSNGFMVVDSQDDQLVTLIPDGVDTRNSTGPAIAVLNADSKPARS